MTRKDPPLLIFCFIGIFTASFAAVAQTGAPMQIIASKCGGCHKPGGDAPFSLTTLADVKKRISTIRQVIESRYMPPWKADDSYCNYSNGKSLSGKERGAILDWIAAGATTDKAGSAKTTNAGGGVIASPAIDSASNDITIKSGFHYTVKGDNVERFVIFKLPFENNREINIGGMEFISGNKRLVHHVNYGLFSIDQPATDIAAGSRFIETDDPNSNQAEYDHLTTHPVYYTGWIPGSSGEHYPQYFGWVLPKRGVVIFTVHFSASPINETFDFGIRLYASSQPIQRKVKIISFGSGGVGEKDITPSFVIEPNKISKFELKMFTRSPQSVMYIWPHMHLLGKSYKAYAVSPGKDTIPLVSIPQWDYRWQELYRMKELTYIPAGSTLVIEGIYDNTSNNPMNPNSPPQRIYPTKNMESNKEMFTLLMIYVPYEPGDEKIKL